MFNPALMEKYLATKGIMASTQTLEDLKKIFYQELMNDNKNSKNVQGNSRISY